jgi:hypothetical protein
MSLADRQDVSQRRPIPDLSAHARVFVPFCRDARTIQADHGTGRRMSLLCQVPARQVLHTAVPDAACEAIGMSYCHVDHASTSGCIVVFNGENATLEAAITPRLN